MALDKAANQIILLGLLNICHFWSSGGHGNCF